MDILFVYDFLQADSSLWPHIQMVEVKINYSLTDPFKFLTMPFIPHFQFPLKGTLTSLAQ